MPREPRPDDQILRAHLMAICRAPGASLSKVGTALGVSKGYLSQLTSGGRAFSDEFAATLLATYPLTGKQQAAVDRVNAPKPPPGVAPQADESAWINEHTRIALECVASARRAAEDLDDLDRILVAVPYQKIRAALFEATPDAPLADYMPPPTEDGPVGEINEARRQLEGIADASRRRESQLIDDDASTMALRHTRLRQSLTVQIGKVTRLTKAGDPRRMKPWGLMVKAVAAVYRDLPDDRGRAVAALRALPLSCAAWADPMADAIDAERALTFPCVEYQHDPVGFIRRVLGGDPWGTVAPHWRTGKPVRMGQIPIAESVRDHKWTVVHTGHKIGKTRLIAWLCLWWYSVWPDGHVMLANFTGKQLEDQDWYEIKQAFRESGICLECKKAGVTQRPCPHSQCIDSDGDIRETSQGGLTSPDGKRFIRGATAREATGVGGYSGAHLLVIIDEFSGMSQELYDGWISNTSSKGSRFLGVGNPIGQDGPMYDAVMVDRVSRHFNVINISSEEAAKTGIEGLADADHIRRVLESDERGRDSPFFMVRIRGLYPTKDEQSTYQMGDIIRAQLDAEYRVASTEGRLILALDPARAEGTGDRFVIGAVRGKKVLEVQKGRGWSDDDCLEIVLDMAKRLRLSDHEVPLVAVDADGPGASVVRRLSDYLESKRIPAHERVRFEVIPVYFGHEAVKWEDYDLTGDEAHAHLAHWLRHGGVFPIDHELEQELQITKWFPVRRNRHGRTIEVMSATRKDGPNGYRKLIHRSPDTLDMLRIFAYAAFMRDALDVPERRSPEAKADAESALDVPPVDDRHAMRQYIDALRRGRLV